jgi:hypothetical protein
MRSAERWPLAFQKNCARKDCVLHLLREFIELRLELLCERNGPLHPVLISCKQYSLEALILGWGTVS